LDVGNFQDASSGDTLVSQNLAASGAAPADGSDLVFNFDGSALLDLASDAPASPNQVAAAGANANGAVTLSVEYEVYRLVPEPSSLLLLSLGGLCVLRRRR